MTTFNHPWAFGIEFTAFGYRHRLGVFRLIRMESVEVTLRDGSKRSVRRPKLMTCHLKPRLRKRWDRRLGAFQITFLCLSYANLRVNTWRAGQTGFSTVKK